MATIPDYGRALGDYLRKYPFAPRHRREERGWVRTADGVKLFVARIAGPPDADCTVVLLHGFLNSSRSPKVHAFARTLADHVNVVVPDLRGHGASGGRTTLGLHEALDVAAAVSVAPPGVPVVTVGTSLGAAAALLHAGSHHGIAGVVAISSPAFYLQASTPRSEQLLRFATGRPGRLVAAAFMRTRIDRLRPEVLQAERLLACIAPAFTLIVHDPDDAFFGPEHAEHLYAHASQPKELWWLPGAGHGTDLLTASFADRLLGALRDRVASAAR